MEMTKLERDLTVPPNFGRDIVLANNPNSNHVSELDVRTDWGFSQGHNELRR